MWVIKKEYCDIYFHGLTAHSIPDIQLSSFKYKAMRFQTMESARRYITEVICHFSNGNYEVELYQHNTKSNN